MSWALARTLSRAGKAARAIATIICLVIISLVALSVGVARTYPGPAWRYSPGTAVYWLYQHVLNSYLALLIPLCAATLVVTLRPHDGRLTIIAAVVLSALLIIPSMVLVLGVACNHAGACL